ncbi:alpha/beta hydrolase [Loktanella sp. SALINAS62]|uniref:alpha/beta fold hydrolase n=1 Tax=Loktanella sp. SALINAS62 TaxID=2706124 RepID=UPI001B8BCEC3|nr:alpha/beta hydrolase [Loktanella sp. SALINAS62]MBS1303017.1 alpha/beta hydrolase [Loktanella sp. SALINAS62]
MRYAPLHSDLADGPDSGAAHWLKTTDNRQIRVGHWVSDTDRGTVLLFPGRTEYIEKYGRAAASLRARGYATITLDWRGQGLAERLLPFRATGHVHSFRDYQKDVAAMLTHARDLGLPKPFYLIAHSMGGAIGLRALIEGLPVRAAMFSAPMWGIQMNASLRPFAWALSVAARRVGMDTGMAPGQKVENYVNRITLDMNELTSDPDMFDYMIHQLTEQPDLGLGGPSLRWLYEALNETRNLARLTSPRTPCLTFLGSAETIVDAPRIRTRMDKWPGGTLDVIDGAKHEVMMETPDVRERVFDATCALFDAHP